MFIGRLSLGGLNEWSDLWTQKESSTRFITVSEQSWHIFQGFPDKLKNWPWNYIGIKML